jgi:hypothetical protein
MVQELARAFVQNPEPNRFAVGISGHLSLRYRPKTTKQRYQGSAQIDVKISFKGRQPNKQNAAKPFCRYVFPATDLHMKRNVITLRIPSMKWSRYSVTNA